MATDDADVAVVVAAKSLLAPHDVAALLMYMWAFPIVCVPGNRF